MLSSLIILYIYRYISELIFRAVCYAIQVLENEVFFLTDCVI